MTAILLVFLLGIALLAVDVFVASFLLTAVGGATMLVGAGLAYRDFGPWPAALAGLAALLLLGGTIFLETVYLPKTRLGRGLVVHSTSGQPPLRPLVLDDVMGRSAEALTTLAPSGYVQVEGRRYEAFCQSGLAAKGDVLRVVGLDNFRIIVSK